ncbi:MAG: cytochrome c5 family protein [Thiohalomonadales bacterium]
MQYRYKILLSACSVLVAGFLFTPALYAADGKAVYTKTCKTCHATGIMGAPKFADKKAWAPRIEKGIATLEKNAIGGFKGKKGTMPPKGGNAALSDDEVKAAVDYLVKSAK